MTRRHSVTRWLGTLGLILSLVGLVSQGTTSAQTPLAEALQNADQGDAAAQFDLGVMYATGQGVPQDDAQAVAWWRRAADQGHARAQNNLGVMYETGQGVPEDFTQAVAWYRQAADQGHAGAQANLANRYRLGGQGVPQNFVEAHKWLILATSRVTDDSLKSYVVGRRDATAKALTPAQLAEAQRLAREWQAAFEKKQTD